ncbi:hypothetical protein [Deinococcus peraridilitoris]|uniref:Uncharacterized protein n=1 Tax=Deinococcus peraridilitoris (strain DSM 19664 / LMG 22246 / CIP 109416 / KR-200) TaxID=937777 RepID=L0A1C6_DEIPD|nr:hypothetical protein [Deinococcus peraridilitoris]AFZ66820.1 hypothetical protein Deipe_1270 [Deinococcus peraridilitoris DSM 19664]
MSKTVSPEDRQKYDQVFMQVVQSVQVEAQNTRPQREGNLAQMFHKSQVTDALQGCAMLIAGWNQNTIDEAAVKKTTTALRGLGLPEIAERVEKLVHIDEA